MSTPEQEPSQAEREQAEQAWTALDRLLPISFDTTLKNGWVEPNTSLAKVYERTPRPRNGVLGSLVWRALGRQPERYRLETRQAAIGQIPENRVYIDLLSSGRKSPVTMPPRLSILDDVFVPIDPIDSNTTVVRHVNATYRTHVGSDWETIYLDGLNFDLLGVSETDRPIPSIIHVSYYGTRNHKDTKTFLADYDFPSPYSYEARDRYTELLELCISKALRPDDNIK